MNATCALLLPLMLIGSSDADPPRVTRVDPPHIGFFAKQLDCLGIPIRAHETGPTGEPNPTYRCLFPSPPPPGSVAPCAEAGVLGALAGVMGSLMAMEVIRAVVGFGEPLVGRLLMVDARSMRFETLVES